MLGNAIEAKQALRMAELVSWDDEEYTTVLSAPLPIGWEALGMGASRVALLSPSNVVYKVELFHNAGNKEEYDNYKLLKSCTLVYCRVAEANLFFVNGEYVIAMENVSDNCFVDGWDKLELIQVELKNAIGICDIHEDNVGIDDNGIAVVFDYAM
jgi:hypothetical protein